MNPFPLPTAIQSVAYGGVVHLPGGTVRAAGDYEITWGLKDMKTADKVGFITLTYDRL